MYLSSAPRDNWFIVVPVNELLEEGDGLLPARRVQVHSLSHHQRLDLVRPIFLMCFGSGSNEKPYTDNIKSGIKIHLNILLIVLVAELF